MCLQFTAIANNCLKREKFLLSASGTQAKKGEVFHIHLEIVFLLNLSPQRNQDCLFDIDRLAALLTDEEGRRFGDIWANTKVVEVDN